MPLTNYTPRVQHEGYDLINQAFNRYVAGQMPKPSISGGGGGGGGEGSLQNAQGQAPGGGGHFSGGPQQVPDFFNNKQSPAYQPPPGSTAAGPGPSQTPAPAAQPQGNQGGMASLGQMLALLGPLQSGNFLGGIGGGNAPGKSFGVPSFLQQQAGAYGNPQGGPLGQLFDPTSYGFMQTENYPGGWMHRGGITPNSPSQWGPGRGFGVGLNPQIQQEALTYILSQLAQGGASLPQQQQGNVGGLIGGNKQGA